MCSSSPAHITYVYFISVLNSLCVNELNQILAAEFLHDSEKNRTLLTPRTRRIACAWNSVTHVHRVCAEHKYDFTMTGHT